MRLLVTRQTLPAAVLTDEKCNRDASKRRHDAYDTHHAIADVELGARGLKTYIHKPSLTRLSKHAPFASCVQLACLLVVIVVV